MTDLIEFTSEPLVYGTPLQTLDTDILDNYKVTYTITSTIDARATIRNSSDSGSTYNDLVLNQPVPANQPTLIVVYGGGQQHLMLIATTSGDSGTAALTMSAESFVLPLTIGEVRNRFKVEQSEYSDEAITQMIRQVYGSFEVRTGRTWIGTQTKTDEDYDGDGTQDLVLNQGDIVSLTSLSIDDDDDGTYTSVTTTNVKLNSTDGVLHLMKDAEVSYFPDEINSIKVSYTYGNSTVTEDIKDILLAMIKNTMFDRTDFTSDLENRIRRYGRKNMVVV